MWDCRNASLTRIGKTGSNCCAPSSWRSACSARPCGAAAASPESRCHRNGRTSCQARPCRRSRAFSAELRAQAIAASRSFASDSALDGRRARTRRRAACIITAAAAHRWTNLCGEQGRRQCGLPLWTYVCRQRASTLRSQARTMSILVLHSGAGTRIPTAIRRDRSRSRPVLRRNVRVVRFGARSRVARCQSAAGVSVESDERCTMSHRPPR